MIGGYAWNEFDVTSDLGGAAARAGVSARLCALREGGGERRGKKRKAKHGCVAM